MKNYKALFGRGMRYIRRQGILSLYRKIQERRQGNQIEAEYETWLASQMKTEDELNLQREAQFENMPLISILVPLYETPEVFLREMIESVLNQTYTKLELCLADASKADKVEGIVAEYIAKDTRIRYKRLKENKGISQNTNESLALATGAWIGLLDHDDILFPTALYEAVKGMNRNSEIDVIYTDEDKVNMNLTRHFQPHFKPDFNLYYLRSNNYICHFFLTKREIANEVGGFREEFDGAQDHDFILRCVEKSREVLHIPQILYSWRSHEASTATNPESKLYAYEAGKRAVKSHLLRMGVNGEVEDTQNYGFYQINYRGIKEIFTKSSEKYHGQNLLNVVYYDRTCNKFVTNTGLFALKKSSYEKMLELLEQDGVDAVCARVYDKGRRLKNEIEMKGVKMPFERRTKGLKEGYSGYFHRVCLQQEVEHLTECFLISSEIYEDIKESSIEELEKVIRLRGGKIIYEPRAVAYER